MNLILIGAMGSGKSSVGRRAAAMLQRPFADTDEWIEGTVGRPVTAIFAEQGEAWFRDRETDALRALLAGGERVLATGGGIVTRACNRALLRAGGLVVLLWAPAETLWERLRDQAGGRPRLQVADPVAVLRDDLARRGPWYRETAHLTVAAGSVAEAAAAAVGALRRVEAAGRG